MRQIEKHGWRRLQECPLFGELSIVVLLASIGVVFLPDALLHDHHLAEGQVRRQFRGPFGRGQLPEPAGEIDGSKEIPFELLYSRSGSVYRNFRYAIESNNTERALLLAQTILNADEDHFVSEESGPAYSMKKIAFDYIESLPKETLKEYQQRWSLDAEVQMDAARKSQDPADYLELVDRYYFTESGFEAVDWLATRSLDLGRFRSASRLWNDAIDSPVHARRVTPMLLIKAAVANRLAGNGERAVELMQRLESSAQGRQLQAKLEEYLKSQAGQTETSRAHVPMTAMEPWQVSLVDSLSDAERDLLNVWRQGQWGENRAPLCISREAVTAGDLLAVRSYNDVLFLDTQTGKVQAKYPVKPSLVDVAEDFEQTRLSGRSSSRSDFLQKFVWNTLHSQLTTDGSRVYLIEEDDSWTDRKPLRPGERILARPVDEFRQEEHQPVPMNRIVALPVEQKQGEKPQTLQPVWTISPSENRPEGTSGAYFLAAPVNVDGALYTLAEQDESIKLMCFDPSAGRLLWSQGVSFPFSMLYEDAERRWRGCVIKDGGDLLVVTTQVGVVVGINPVRRTLEWVYFIGEASANRRFGNARQIVNTSYNYLGFLDEPLLADGRVLLLPRQSQNLHCLNLETGQPEWKVPRYKPVNSSDQGGGDEFLGGVHEHVLIVVGTRNTRGVSMHDGSELWRVSHPQISGRGVFKNGHYLLPLQQGSFWRIEAATGRVQKLDLAEDSSNANDFMSLAGVSGDHELDQQTAPRPPFGHLVVNGPQLISLGIENIRTLNEPSARYLSLKALAAQRELTLEEQLEFVTLSPASEPRERVSFLEEMLSSNEMPPEVRRRMLDVYQRELFLVLKQHPEDLVAISHKLEDLLRTDEDRIRLAILRSQRQMEQLDADGVLDSLGQLLRFDSDQLFAVPGDEDLTVSVGAWVRVIWNWAESQESAAIRTRFATFLNNELNTVLASDDPAALNRILHQFPRLPQLDEVRLRLAKSRKAESRYHEAEMLLLTLLERNESSPQKTDAVVELAELWSIFGLDDRAAGLLLDSDFVQHRAELSQPALQKLNALSAQPQMQAAFDNYQLPDVPLQQVFVESHAPGYRQHLIAEAYDQYFRIYPTTVECQFDLLAKRHPSDTRQHVLTVVSRKRGTVAAEIPIPSRGNGLATTEASVVGHYFPFASQGQIRGISLIETADGQPGWTRSFLDPEMNELLYVGQFDAEQTCFRTHESLVMVSSRDGRVIWRRDHLERQGSLNGNPRLSLFGDERIVARRVGESDFEVYDANTGGPIPLTQSLPISGLMGTVGRYLVAISYTDSEQPIDNAETIPRVSIIDVETGEEVYSSPYWTRHCCNLTGEKLVLIDRQRVLRVIDVARQQEILAIPVNQQETDSVTRLEYFTDADNHYVNIRRVDDHQRNPGRNNVFANFASNPFLPTIDIVGQLIAIDRQSGERRWDRLVQSCSVLQSPDASLPFLAMLSWRVENRVPNTRRLHLEVLSPHSGETLGSTDNFVPLDQHQQIYHSRYSRKEGLLELNGPMYRATIRFNTPAEQLLRDDNPL